jgi:hypothetical protein
MALPRMTAAQSLAGSEHSYAGALRGSLSGAGISPQGCLGCITATALCGATCLLGPEVCVPCLASIGMQQCLSCLTDIFS